MCIIAGYCLISVTHACETTLPDYHPWFSQGRQSQHCCVCVSSSLCLYNVVDTVHQCHFLTKSFALYPAGTMYAQGVKSDCFCQSVILDYIIHVHSVCADECSCTCKLQWQCMLGMYSKELQLIKCTVFVTPRACIRGKAISFVRLFVCLSAQKLRDLEIQASQQDASIITVLGRCENLPSFAFQALEKGHECYKSRVSIGHAFQPPPIKLCHVLLNRACSNSIVHVLTQVGKCRHFIN